MRRTIGAVVSAAALVAMLSGCEGAIENHVRQRFEPDPPVADEGLRTLARAHSEQMCSDGAVSATSDPDATYGEVAVELVDREPLDPDLDPPEDDHAATVEIWDRFDHDPRLDAETWERMGAGQATCDDGNLYMTLVLQADPAPPFPGWASGVRRATAGDGTTSFGGITADGGTVAIQSEASDLAPGSSTPDAWLYDVGSHTLSPQGIGAAVPALSPDGSTLVFMREVIENGSVVFPIESRALADGTTTRLVTNFSPGDPRSLSADGSVVAVQVYGAGGSTLQLIRNGTVESGGSLDGASFALSVSDDGTQLASNGFDASVRDLVVGFDVAVASNCLNSSTQLPSTGSSLSASGGAFAYACYDRPGDPSDTDHLGDLFVWDRNTGTSVRVTPGDDGLAVQGQPSMSDDGRFVAFSYGSSDTTGATYLWDRAGGVLTQIATVPSEVAVSGDGSVVAFCAVAPDRASGSSIQDLFVWHNPAA